ncbi:DUF6193 family natural product biosynthesis protein [Thermomonospora umbrina]|nr:DUF6193 family natural product biosynthesis protein [Thermomonospora umbrina]
MRSKPEPRPLPRSLVPLPDETIPGYLLRLSHRLDQSPAILARATGLANASGLLPNKPLLRLTDAALRQFAFICRLTEIEARAMPLGSLGHRYIPLDLKFQSGRAYNWTGLRSSSGIPYVRWILTRDARFCPSCLAGNSDPIQLAHGGAWKRTWRIPFVFACPDHECLLSNRCPQCDNTLPGGVGLVHRPGEVLHPAQCRSSDPDADRDSRNSRPCCGFRLDSTPAQIIDPSLREGLLALQRRLLNILLADSPDLPIVFGRPGEPERYLADLRLLMILITQTWPLARNLDRPALMNELMDQHVETCNPRTQMTAPGSDKPERRPLSDIPPSGVLACATVIAIADQLLQHPDHTRIEELIFTMTSAAQRTPATELVRRNLPFCSAAFKDGYSAHWTALKATRRPRGKPTRPAKPEERGGAGFTDALRQNVAMTAVPTWQDLVEAGWREVREDGRVREELIDAAYAEPRLRQLFPWTGMGELHFSRCTGKRWTWDIPYIQPTANGGYWISGPLRIQSVGPAWTADEAISMILEHLPPGCGPAFVGTPEELAAHEAANATYRPAAKE